LLLIIGTTRRAIMAPPKIATKAKPKPKAKVKTDTKRTKATSAVAGAFPDFADDDAFCGELAQRVLAAIEGGVVDNDALQTALEDALLGQSEEDAASAVDAMILGLEAVGLISAPEAAVVAVQPAAPAAAAVLSEGRFKSIFSKELARRERAAGEHTVSKKALACLHDWDSTGVGGIRCQVCDFETKDKSYGCRFDCGVQLCGKCWWKWKER